MNCAPYNWLICWKMSQRIAMREEMKPDLWRDKDDDNNDDSDHQRAREEESFITEDN